MHNIALVTGTCAGGPRPRHSLRLIPTLEGRLHLDDEYWLYDFIADSVCLEGLHPGGVLPGAVAFGSFKTSWRISRLTPSARPSPLSRPHHFAQFRQARADAAGAGRRCGEIPSPWPGMGRPPF